MYVEGETRTDLFQPILKLYPVEQALLFVGLVFEAYAKTSGASHSRDLRVTRACLALCAVLHATEINASRPMRITDESFI